MQILVVVAIIQVRILKAEVEKGSMRTEIGHGLLDPKTTRKRLQRRVSLRSRKGMGLTFPKLVVGQNGNINELRDASAHSWKSFLFFLTVFRRGIGLSREATYGQVERPAFGPSGAFAMALENLREKISRTPDRTNNRIRSPRLAASGQLEECR